jgi:hypothetical protein
MVRQRHGRCAGTGDERGQRPIRHPPGMPQPIPARRRRLAAGPLVTESGQRYLPRTVLMIGIHGQ